MIRIFDKGRPQSTPAALPPVDSDPGTITALETRHVELLSAADADEQSAAAIESEVPALDWQLAQLHEKRGTAIHQGNTAVVEQLGEQMSFVSVRIEDAAKRAAEFRQAAAAKRKEAGQVEREIQAVQRAPLELQRREKIEALIPVLVEAARMMAGVHAAEHELQQLGSQLEPAAWNQLSFSGGEGILIETWFSRWLDARRAEGFTVPQSENGELHIPPSTAEWARTQIDAGYAAHAVRCGTRAGTQAGIATGFRQGFLNRARNYS
jgi:hypothetical protein